MTCLDVSLDFIHKIVNKEYNFVLWCRMVVFHQLCIDKCHENGWNVDMLLQDPVPGLVIPNYG